MKILFISDVHGIKKNLEVIKERLEKENFDKFVVLGDLYYPGYNSFDNEDFDIKYIKEFLDNYKSKIIAIKGNCDSDVDIKANDFPVCDKLALIHTDDLDIYCTHGNEYNMEKDIKFDRKGILVHGHFHYPFIEKKKDMIYINTGSISLPRNNSKPSYLIYENKEFIIYDIEGNILNSIKL